MNNLLGDSNQATKVIEKPQAANDVVTEEDLLRSFLGAYRDDGKDEEKKIANEKVKQYIRQQADQFPILEKYNLILLYDDSQMVRGDADSIYSTVTSFNEKKPILLILHSSGGYIGPAYLIGKLLRESADGDLDIVVPRRAKSAATLLCCAANHIHMGALSELGPIDPQFEGLPVLGLKSAIEHLAEIVKEYPCATDLFARYLTSTIQPIHLGYYERVAQSAVQYAERLLENHKEYLAASPAKIAHALVYSYKDHGFVIDYQEAKSILGVETVKVNTDEYSLGNALYKSLDFISKVAALADYNFHIIGGLNSSPTFTKKQKSSIL